MNKIDVNLATDIKVLKRIAKRKRYNIFDDNSKPFNLNIWGIRNRNLKAGYFDDLLVVFWKENNGAWTVVSFEVTTDPSDISLINFRNNLGTAIITEAQHRGVWQLGLHKGQYEALVQRRPITVIRDFNKDGILDIPSNELLDKWKYEKVVIDLSNRTTERFEIDGVLKYIRDTGYFGINCHRASKYNILEKIGLYSEGCVVFKNPVAFESSFMVLINNAVANWGNSFTFTLCNEKELYL